MPQVQRLPISKGLHLENVVKELVFDMKFVKERSLQHGARIHELFSLLEGTATKAEVHAAVAGLSYRNMSGALPPEFLSGVINHRFQGQIADDYSQGQSHPPEKLRQQTDLGQYLTNPHDALVAMSERIKKLEAVVAADAKTEAEEARKVHRDITAVLKKMDSSDDQFGSLQREVHYQSGVIKRLQQLNTSLQQQLQNVQEGAASMVWARQQSDVSDMDGPGAAPNTPGADIVPLAQRNHGSDALDKRLLAVGSISTEEFEELDSLSELQADLSIVAQEGSIGLNSPPSSTHTAAQQCSVAAQQGPVVTSTTGASLQSSSMTQVIHSGSIYAPVLLDSIDYTDASAPEDQHYGPSKTQIVEQQHEPALAEHTAAVSSAAPSLTASLPPAGAVICQQSEIPPKLPLTAPAHATDPPTPANSQVTPALVVPPQSGPSISINQGPTPLAKSTATPAVETRQHVAGSTSHTSAVSNLQHHLQQQYQLLMQQINQQQQYFQQLQEQKLNGDITKIKASLANEVLREVLSRTETGFGDRIRAVESSNVQIDTLTEAVMVLSQEHRALTVGHKQIEQDQKAYQGAYLVGIEQMASVVERCFEKVEQFSTESTALGAKNIISIEEDVGGLKASVQSIEEKLVEIDFAVKTLPLSFTPHAPAPPSEFNVPSLIVEEESAVAPPREGATADELADRAERVASREARRTANEQQQTAQNATSEQLRTVITELFRLNTAVGEVKQKCEQLEKTRSQPVTSVRVTASPRSALAVDTPTPPQAARPSVSRPRTSSALSAPKRTYSTSIATEAARQATEEGIESARLRSMRTEMAGLRDEMDKIRAVAMSSIYLAQQSAQNAAATPPAAGLKGISKKANQKGCRPSTATFEHNLQVANRKHIIHARATSAPLSESPRKEEMRNTMARVRRTLEEQAQEEGGEGGVPPVQVDPPVRWSSHQKNKERETTDPRKSAWARTSSSGHRRHPLDGASVESASEEQIGRIGESNSSLMWAGTGGPGHEFSMSYYMSSHPVCPDASEERNHIGDTFCSTTTQDQKESWFRYVDEPPHAPVVPSVNRIRNVSPPQVQPEKRRAAAAMIKLSDDSSADSVDFEGGGSDLYKGEWTMSLSVAKTEGIGGSGGAQEGTDKSSLLLISGSGVLSSGTTERGNQR